MKFTHRNTQPSRAAKPGRKDSIILDVSRNIKGGLIMYLIGIKKGVHPCGNTGTLISHYKAEYKIRETAQRFATMHSLDEVYRLDLYPQKLCELNPAEFTEYIRKNCIRYV